MKILFIEDDPATTYLYRDMMMKFPNDIVTFCLTSSAGLGELQSNMYDIAFVDYSLKPKDADVLLYALKNQPIKTKIYILTGMDSQYIQKYLEPVKALVTDIIHKGELVANSDKIIQIIKSHGG